MTEPITTSPTPEPEALPNEEQQERPARLVIGLKNQDAKRADETWELFGN